MRLANGPSDLQHDQLVNRLFQALKETAYSVHLQKLAKAKAAGLKLTANLNRWLADAGHTKAKTGWAMKKARKA